MAVGTIVHEAPGDKAFEFIDCEEQRFFRPDTGRAQLAPAHGSAHTRGGAIAQVRCGLCSGQIGAGFSSGLAAVFALS